MGKVCEYCGEEKPADMFFNSSAYKSGKSPFCKDCARILNKLSQIRVAVRQGELPPETLMRAKKADPRWKPYQPNPEPPEAYVISCLFTGGRWKGRIGEPHDSRCMATMEESREVERSIRDW